MVVEIEDAESGQHSLWIFDTARGTRSRLTRAPHDGHHPVWSPDGREMAFTSSRTGKWLAYRQRTDGLGEDTLLFDAPELLSLYPRVWATDGRGILAASQEKDGRRRLWWLPARSGEAARPLVDGNHAALSPDGRWLAVEARHAGRSQIHVLPFPALDTRVTVSVDGGRWPRWRADGRELFYVSEDLRLMSVPVAAGATFDASAPVALFPLPPLLDPAADYPPPYDVEPTGERFVLCIPPEDRPAPLATLITDWRALLRGPAEANRD